jgi:uncharacterized heparinase superfamily protein
VSTAEKFEQFHQDNPIVYDTLHRLAKEWVAMHGKQKLGLRMIWEVARWQIIASTKDTEYKMNNNYTGYYARLLQMNDPDLDGLFEIRASPADQWALTKLGLA